jgi:hypothetical protein
MNILFTNEFNKVAGVEQYINIPADILSFRKSLVLEELEELQDAIKANDRVEQLDAICDLLVVANGWLYVKGVSKVKLSSGIFSLEECFHLIHCVIDNIDDVTLLPSYIFYTGQSLGFSKSTIIEALHEVHRSNMSKFCLTEQEAVKSVDSYLARGVISYYKKVGHQFVIFRKSDNKILKGINFSSPSLSQFT